MQIHHIKSNNKKSRKRVGRGGKKGTYSGKGMKGQKSRSGYSRRATFEGGRSSLVAQAKKVRGFKSKKAPVQIINLRDIEKKYSAGEVVSMETLKEKGLIKKTYLLVKVLSEGELTKKITLKGVAFSKLTKEKVEQAGGEVK